MGGRGGRERGRKKERKKERAREREEGREGGEEGIEGGKKRGRRKGERVRGRERGVGKKRKETDSEAVIGSTIYDCKLTHIQLTLNSKNWSHGGRYHGNTNPLLHCSTIVSFDHTHQYSGASLVERDQNS